MGLLDDALRRDAVQFANSDVFAEPIVYVKPNGTTRNINAIVIRGVPDTLPGVPQSLLGRIVGVWVANSTTRGVAESELLLRQDKLRVPKYDGAGTEDLPITAKVNIDAGMMELRLR